MASALSWLVVFGLMGVTAGGYALATIGMKLSSAAGTMATAAIIVLGLAGAALAEIALLRNASLSVVYLGIVVTETALVLAYACWDRQGVSLAELAGAALVLAGFALVSAQA
jgi:small multidrug resistance pump